MKDAPRIPDEMVDALVRSHLSSQAESVDPVRILAEVKRRRRKKSPSFFRGTLFRRGAALTAAAAVLALAFLGGRTVGPSAARAETIVREAKAAHALPVDRCYLVQWTPEPEAALLSRLAHPRELRLWTRGDRFWLESTNPDRRWASGLDDQGAVWLALGRRSGLRYQLDEAPEPVALTCEVCCLRVESLLDEVLSGFDLRREESDPGAATYRIRAEPKPGGARPGLRGALLEIDAESRVLRRLVLQRTHQGKPLAVVTFTLLETGSSPDSDYQLEGHLDADAPVLTGKEAQRRHALLRAFFGLQSLKPVR
jgi:hypothetical protein